MTFGSRLVIPGAFFGSMLMALFLFMVTAGASYPAPPVEAAAAQSVKQSDALPVAVDSQGVISEDGQCEVSQRFPDKVLKWCGLITQAAHSRGLEPNLIAALILQESGGNEVAYSKSGAVGLMQVMPRDGLAASFSCINGPCFSDRPTIAELEDPDFNVQYGTKMLASLLNRHGNIRDALKAYGPMNVGYYYADIVLGLFQRYGE